MNAIPLCRCVYLFLLLAVLETPLPKAQAAKGSRPKKARAAGRKYAFLVAVGKYDKKELRPLEYTVNDVLDFAKALRASGFKDRRIVLMHDKQEPRYLPEVKKIGVEFRLLLRQLEKQDTLIVAFSGHGVQFKGRGKKEPAYFCPLDASLEDRSTLIPLEDLYGKLQACRAQRKLLLVDACRNDPLPKGSKSLPEVDLETLRGPQEAPIPKGIVAFFSCSNGEKSYEEAKLKHGVFFYHVLRGWNGAAANKAGEVTLDALVAYTKSQTKDYVRLNFRANQQPYLRSDLEGDWVLRKLKLGRREFDQAVAALDKKDYPRALQRFAEAARINPKYAKNSKYAVAYYERGRAYRDKGDYDRATADYTQAIRINPKYAPAYHARGVAYWWSKQYDQAITDYTEAIRLKPQWAGYYNNRGMAYYAQGHHRRAIADYTRAIRRDPKFALAYVNRGNAYRKIKRDDRAIADYTQAIRFDGKNAAAYAGRGNAYRDKGDKDRAIADYTEALALSPKDAVSYHNRGMVFNNSKQYDRAIADYTEAIRLNPKYALAYNNRGLAHGNKKQFDQAITDYTEAIRLDRKFASPYYNRGNVYRRTKQFSRAIADYNMAIGIDSKFALTYKNRSEAYKAMGNKSRAQADMKIYRRMTTKK